MWRALEAVNSLRRVDPTSADYLFIKHAGGQYLISICASLIWTALEFWIAMVFYRCGPRVLRFFLGKEPETAETVTS